MLRRYQQRLSLLAIFGLLVSTSLFSARIGVTNSDDAGPGSFRQAVADAMSGDTIEFWWQSARAPVMLQSPIMIDKGLYIKGRGTATTFLDAGGSHRALMIDTDEDVYLGFVTVRNGFTADNGGGILHTGGQLTLDGVLMMNNEAGGTGVGNGGGALHSSGSNLLIAASRFMNNTATGMAGSGGAILTDGTGFSITGSTFTDNTANRAGGGLEMVGDPANGFLNRVTMTGNRVGPSPGNGGGVHITGGSNLTVNGGSYNGNVAASEGGGLWNSQGEMVIRGAVINGNTANGAEATNGGGGVFNDGGSLRILNGTEITNNTATVGSGSGGGVHNVLGGQLRIAGTLIMGNTAARAGGGVEDASDSNDPVIFTDTRVMNNEVLNSPGNGGGIHVGGAGNITFRSGVVNNNAAGAEGGGIWIGTGALDVGQNVEFTGNTAAGDAANQGGGALFTAGAGSIKVRSGVTFTSNFATGASGSGGAILVNTGGSLDVNGATFTGNSANRAGGAIEDNTGSGLARITNSDFTNNTTGSAPGNGGAIHITGAGDMDVTGGTFSGNVAASEGGALWNGGGTMTVRGSVIDGNDANGMEATNGGGGLFNNGGTLVVLEGTEILNNTAATGAGSGGGIHNIVGGNLEVIGALIMGNTAARAGGGVEDASETDDFITFSGTRVMNNEVLTSPGNGGGIHVGGAGNITFRSGVISNNIAGAEGGGIWIGSGQLDVGANVTFTGNTAAGGDADQGGGALFTAGAGSIRVRNGVVFDGNTATGASGSGGAILTNAGAALNIDGATFRNNTANRAGGAIEDNSGADMGFATSEVFNSVFENNSVGTAPGNGGAIHITGPGNMFIRGSRFDDNVAGSEGGGVWNGSGTMRLFSSTFDGNVASGADADNGGGAIFNNGGNINIIGITVTNNSATGAAGSGGGLLTTGGNVVTVSSTFDGNSANRAGGAVEQIDGFFVAGTTTFSNNTTGDAPGNGGAFHVTGNNSVARFIGGRVVNNNATNEGGGLWNQSGTTMLITNVTIDGNTVGGAGDDDGDAGAGVFNNGGSIVIQGSTISNNEVLADNTFGGGIFNGPGGDISLTGSTVANNITGGSGGGVANNGSFTATNATIGFNTAGTNGGGFFQDSGDAEVTFTGSIIADNTATAGGGQDIDVSGGMFTSNGFNLIGNDELNQFMGTSDDIIDGNADLQPLAANGGGTFTLGLGCSSDAIDAGDASDTSTDQNGQALVGTRDIGAFELQVVCAPPLQTPGLQEQTMAEMGNVSVYPNPSFGTELNVVLPLELEGETVIRVLDTNGRLRTELRSRATSPVRLPVQELSNGSYFIQVVNGDLVTTRRVLIQR